MTTPVLSRLYTPSDYGEWSIFSGYISIFGVVMTGGYELAIIKTKNRTDIPNLIALCLIILLILIFFLSSILVFSNILNITYINSLPLKWFMILYLLLTGIQGIGMNYSNRMQKYNTIAIGELTSGVTQSLMRILFAELKINGLIIGTLVARIYECFYYMMRLRKNLSVFSTKIISVKRIVGLAVEHKKFPLFDAPSSLLTFASLNVPILILATAFKKTEVGYYSMVLQILLLPMSFVGSAMGKVYYREVSFFENDSQVLDVSMRTLKISLLIAVAPILFFCFGGDHILEIFLGRQWKLAGTFALFLSLWAFPSIVLFPLYPIYRYRNRQNILFNFNLVFTTLTIIALLVGIWIWNDILKTLLLYSITGFAIKVLQIQNIFSLCGIQLKRLNTIYLIVFISAILIWCIRVFFILT